MIIDKNQLLRTKKEIREEIWTKMTQKKVGAFPFPLYGRISNFLRANDAAQRLFSLQIWENAQYVKINPDSPQRWVRQRALEEGKILYMAVPRLRSLKCFIRIQVPPQLAKKASSIRGAFKMGEPLHPREMRPIDLVIMGSVAVNSYGERIGKGGGYGDLELALAHKFHVLSPDTPIVTTVHDLQVTTERFRLTPHDALLDYIATPTKMIRCEEHSQKNLKIFWEALSSEQIKKMPILNELQKLS